MKTRLVFFVACVVLMSSQAYSLEGRYTFNPVNYGDGWFPWACTVYKGTPSKGVTNTCGAGACPMIPRIQGPNVCAGELSTSFIDPNKAYGAIYTLSARITIPEDIKLVTSGSAVVTGEVCAGENIQAVKGVSKGEWWDDGGNADSPPVYWVDDVENLAKSLLNRQTTKNFFSETTVPDGYVDPITNVPVYTKNFVLGNVPASLSLKGTVTGNIVCSLKQKPGTGLPAEGAPVSGESEVEVDVTYIVECMYYYYSGGCAAKPSGFFSEKVGYCLFNVPAVVEAKGYQSIEDFFKVGEISVKRKIKVVKPAAPGVEVSVPASGAIQANSRNVLKIDVKNTGDVDISVKDIDSPAPHGFISCDAVTVKPGSTTECLLSITPAAGEGLDVKVSYEYRYCGKTVKASVVKSLINSNVIMSKSAVQVYAIDVHGACENQYYACSPAASQEKYSVGYKCFAGQSGYYTPTVGRLGLTYDLSGIPPGTDISAARFVLTASGAGRPQELALYSVSGDLSPMSCVPGGDICTRPYCKECEPLFALSGEKVSTQSVSGPGKYSFDITELLKKAYSGGQKTLSFQVRAEEGLWSSEGSSSCDKENDWVEQGIDLRSAGDDGPHIEIVHK